MGKAGVSKHRRTHPNYDTLAEREMDLGGKLDRLADGYDADDDFAKSLLEGYRAIKERQANGGPGWTPKPVPAKAGMSRRALEGK